MAKSISSGIYCIEHIASGRLYVGSAANIDKRWAEHRRQLAQGRHHSRFLQRAWDKHGEASFLFRVVLLCNRHNLLSYEQALLDAWLPEFNSSPTAGSQLGFRHRPESRQKMSASNNRTGNPGYSHTEESKRRISENRKGKGGGERSPERLAKISAALKGRPCPAERRQRIAATLKGTSTGRGSLVPAQVREVRRLRSQGWGRIRIGKALGISEHAADAVIGGHAYLWVK